MAEGLCTWTAGKHREEPSHEAQGPGATVSGREDPGGEAVALMVFRVLHCPPWTTDWRNTPLTCGEVSKQPRGGGVSGQQGERKRSAMRKELEEAAALGSDLCLKPALPSGDLRPSPDLGPLVYDRCLEVSSLFRILLKA